MLADVGKMQRAPPQKLALGSASHTLRGPLIQSAAILSDLAEPTSADAIAQAVLNKYDELPANGKPKVRTNGASEWTVLAGFCLCDVDTGAVDCVSLGTGLKVLPHAKLPVHGDVLHDSHAEVIARRGLILFLFGQLRLALEDKDSVLESEGARWSLRKGLKLCLYVSMLPCGDASTFYLSLLPSSPSTANDSAPPPPASHPSILLAAELGLHTSRIPSQTPQVHRGRISYLTPSTLRTKPGRPDSPPSTSHSCSDKLALWSVAGVQGALLSRWMDRTVLDMLVVGDVPVEHEDRILAEVEKAVGGRLGSVGTTPRVAFTTLAFADARPGHNHDLASNASCPESISFISGLGTEILVNGAKQGASLKRPTGGALSVKARSRLCKLSMFQTYLELASESLTTTYFEAKALSTGYQLLRESARTLGGPLEGWLISGKAYESMYPDGSVLEP